MIKNHDLDLNYEFNLYQRKRHNAATAIENLSNRVRLLFFWLTYSTFFKVSVFKINVLRATF